MKEGNLVKLRAKEKTVWAYCWNLETDDYVSRNYIHMPDKYPAEDAWAGNHSILIDADDIGVFIKKVPPNPDSWSKEPVDIVMFQERMVGIEARKIRTRTGQWPRTVRYESRIKRVTKRDY